MLPPLQVWSDIACPWCFVGKRRLEAALREVGLEAPVVWRSFELDPRPRSTEPEGKSYVERLARKYGVPDSKAQGMIDSMTERGKREGIDFRFDIAVPANTFDAHRLVHAALHADWDPGTASGSNADAVTDRHGRLKERLFLAHLCEGVDLGDHGELIRLATECGLSADFASSVLGSTLFADEVRADEDEAMGLGVRGVPFFVIGRYGIMGAQESATLAEVLIRASDEAQELESGLDDQFGESDEVCTSDGCE